MPLQGFRTGRYPKTPKSVVKAGASALTWWADHISHTPPMYRPSEIEYTSEYLYFDNSKAKSELKLELIPVETSFKKSISWFRNGGYA